MKVLSLENIKKNFGNKEVLKDLNIELSSGEIVGFLGRNGQGKSTTLKIIMGLIFPDSGNIRFFEDKYDKPRSKIGFIHESPVFWGEITPYEFLYSLSKMGYNNTENNINELLEFVGLTDNKNSLISSFSRGMKQRLGIAQALLNNPEILILDEPMTALDPLGKSEMKRLLKKLKKNGKSILFSSHQLHDIKGIADRFILLNNGKIVLNKSANDIEDLEDFFLKGVSK
jgi:ABC-2 type transport system ATP-binding protein